MLKRKILTIEWILIVAFLFQIVSPDTFSAKSSLIIFALLIVYKYFREGFRLNIFQFLFTQITFTLSHHSLLKIAMVLITILSVLYFPVYRFPETMGHYFVGFKVLKLKNHIEVSVYYPTTTLTDPVAYTPSKKAWLRFHQYLLFKGSKLPSWIFHIGLSFLKYVELPVQFESPIIPKEHLSHIKKFPVVLLSHGMACNRNLYTTFAREWASNGYIIFSVDHQETVDLPSGFTMKEYYGYRFTQVKKRKEAILKVLDYISNVDNIQDFFDNSNVELDLNRVSVVGQSFGGAAVAYTAMNDKRINGVCILLDPDLDSIYDEMTGKSLNLPLLIIRTRSMEVSMKGGRNYKEMITQLLANNKEYSKQSLSCIFENATPISQTDLVLHIPRESMILDMMTNVDVVEDVLILNNKLTQIFLDTMLYGKETGLGMLPTIDTVLKKYSSFAKKLPRKTKLLSD